ncbi:hypothetical protein HdyHp2_025 [Haloarcula virus Hardyhisp2]|uniref:Uncharacterized protein n=1 Tax=Haloarcula virus Hardyhisp2 TaxID=2811386 RepID=A0A898KBK8_9VIRU|nr:hypothetical protein QIT44_gp05 [Haloarcula virus Hardyhisp2]QSJ05025.1 hypothetical protein HdyHp2_025 [Haloarcula virus Hardyhisp2]
MLNMTKTEERQAKTIVAKTIGIVIGIILFHNVACSIAGTNCGTSLVYLL